jgi:hypothetical protein
VESDGTLTGDRLGALLGTALLCLFGGVLLGQALQRHTQRLEKIEGRYWDLYHRVDPQGRDAGREGFRATVTEAVGEALRRDRAEA